MRTTTPQTRKVAMQRLKETAEGVAQAMGARAFVRYRPGYIAQKNDDSVMDVVMETAEECIGKENIFIKEYPSMGVEDFAFYSGSVRQRFFSWEQVTGAGKITGYITENLRRMRVLWISPCSWRL